MTPAASIVAVGFVCVASLLLMWSERNEGTGIALVGIGAFFYLYVIQPTFLLQKEKLQFFLTDDQVVYAELMAAVMLVIFLLGWRSPGKVGKEESRRQWNYTRLWNFGYISALGGAIAYGLFVSRSGGIQQTYGDFHGSGAAWSENTAYLYLGPWWVLSGSSMMMVASIQGRLSPWRRRLPFLFAVVVGLHGLLVASRGTTFSCCAVVGCSYALAKRKNVRPFQALPYLAVLGLAVLLVLGYRGVLYLGADRGGAIDLTEALQASLDINDASAQGKTTGSEFVLYAAAVQTVRDTGKVDFGLNWLYVYTIHPIPRIWWQDKPYGFDFPVISWDDIMSSTGLNTASGAAAGAVGDIYEHFYWLSPVVFFFLGKAGKHLFLRAQRTTGPSDIVIYVMLYALSLNAFGQGVGAILVPLPYSLLPLLAFRVIGNPYLKQKVSSARGFGGPGGSPNGDRRSIGHRAESARMANAATKSNEESAGCL